MEELDDDAGPAEPKSRERQLAAVEQPSVIPVDAGAPPPKAHYAYTPVMPPELWEHLRPFVEDLVRTAAPATAYTEKQLYPAVTKLARWASETAGLPLKAKLILHPANIDRFANEGLVAYTNAGRATMRSKLRRVAAAILDGETPQDRKRPMGKAPASSPYTEPELATLLSWVNGQPTRERKTSVGALLALGIGAGLTGREIVAQRLDGVTVDEAGVVVHVAGDDARDVPVVREWEHFLVERLTLVGSDAWAFRSGQEGGNINLITDFVSRSHKRVNLQARRMRATWLVHHLSAGTPVTSLMRAAGLQSIEALDRLLPLAEGRPEREYRDDLRGE